jgi:predicted NAD-dependent protein-ADP-ribosyltransferase YbiA (DUF1768 family)
MPTLDLIEKFTGRYEALSNFADAPLTWEDIDYPSAEAGFNAGKTLDPVLRAEIAAVPTPRKAEDLGRAVPLRGGWPMARCPGPPPYCFAASGSRTARR